MASMEYMCLMHELINGGGPISCWYGNGISITPGSSSGAQSGSTQGGGTNPNSGTPPTGGTLTTPSGGPDLNAGAFTLILFEGTKLEIGGQIGTPQTPGSEYFSYDNRWGLIRLEYGNESIGTNWNYYYNEIVDGFYDWSRGVFSDGSKIQTGALDVAGGQALDANSIQHAYLIKEKYVVQLTLGSAAGDQIVGNGIIFGNSGADTLVGSYLHDILNGGEDNDDLNGGLGADVLDGGAGYDFASYYHAASGVVASLANAGVNTGEASGDVYNSIEGLAGSRFNDILTGNMAWQAATTSSSAAATTCSTAGPTATR